MTTRPVPRHRAGDELYASYDDEFAERRRVERVVRARVRALRSAVVHKTETILMRAATAFGLRVYFDPDKYRRFRSLPPGGAAMFLFESPVPVRWRDVTGFPSVNVLDGTIYWPVPLLRHGVYTFVHEVAHLVVGAQPPTVADEAGLATFELGLVRYLRAAADATHTKLDVDEEAWWDWRVGSGNDKSTVRDRAVATQTTLVGSVFDKDGAPIRQDRFWPAASVEQMVWTWTDWTTTGRVG